jgi:demethylmenaquinone methyltransferase/2-methoxy-6-polyprenyl-1,4-benzoquinol methylase
VNTVNEPNRKSWDTAALPVGEAKAVAVRQMFDTIAPRYDLVNRIMTFRLDVRWRRSTVAALDLDDGALVLDVASGTGDLCRELSRQRLQPLSCDFSFGMLAADTSHAPRVQSDAQRLAIRTAGVDGITCGFALRNFVDLSALFTELARVVLLDVSVPTNPLVRYGNSLYFGKVVPRIGALLSDRAAYRYLPRSVSYLPAPPELCAMLSRAGFVEVKHRQLSGGLVQLLTATRAQ